MPDIFDEVSEDLRHDQAVALAKRYGGLLLILAVLVLAGVAGWQFWTTQRQKAADAAAAKYLAITQSVDQTGASITPDQAKQAAQALETFAATAPEGYKTLATLRAAALTAQAGDNAGAEALWTSVSQDGSADQLLRDLASLLWAQHALGTAPDADVLARLQPLLQDSNPYHALARETQALAYLHEGNKAMAKSLFSQIAADPSSPDGVRNRAQGLLGQLNG